MNNHDFFKIKDQCYSCKFRSFGEKTGTVFQSEVSVCGTIATVTKKPKPSLTVQFYIYMNVHWPMFESLFEYLKRRQEVKEIVLCLPNIPYLTNCGISFSLLEKRIVTDPRKVGANVTFIADTIAGKVSDCSKIVNVVRGTISKGYYFTKNLWTERENWPDLLYVPGNYARRRLETIVRTRVAATDMPKMDSVFTGHYERKRMFGRTETEPLRECPEIPPLFIFSSDRIAANRYSDHRNLVRSRLDSCDAGICLSLL
jgi:hypothetical protein